MNNIVEKINEYTATRIHISNNMGSPLKGCSTYKCPKTKKPTNNSNNLFFTLSKRSIKANGIFLNIGMSR